MDCHLAKERLTEGRETAAVRRHLDRCEDCAAFSRELAAGGREIAEAFLDVPPSSGFEARVSARIREREIAVPLRKGGRFVRLLAPAMFVLLALAIWRLAAPGETPLPPKAAEIETQEVVATEPVRELPVYLSVWRDRQDGPTRVNLSFTGKLDTVALDISVEDHLLTAWALGARRAQLSVSTEIPGREVVKLLTWLERTGFSYELIRARL